MDDVVDRLKPAIADREFLAALGSALKSSYTELETVRRNRVSAVRQYIGSETFGGGSRKLVLMNEIARTVRTYVRYVAANSPGVLVSTEHLDLKSSAHALTIGLNHLIDEIRLEDTLRRAFTDSLFGIGCVKTGLCPAYKVVEIDGYLHDAGQPFADCVDLDDLVFDIRATRLDQIQFIGNRWRMRLCDAQESEMFDRKARRALIAAGSPGMAGDGIEELTRTRLDRDADLEPIVELWDVWLPYHGQLVTIAADSSSSSEDFSVERALRVVDYDGPENGPYELLNLSEVPKSLIGLPPILELMPLHEFVNNLARKVHRQARRQKTLFGGRDAEEEESQRIINAVDGEYLKVDPNSVTPIVVPGADGQLVATLIWALQRYNHSAGNIDALGGIGPQSATATQDTMIYGNASKLVNDMQARFVGFTTRVVRKLAWYMWTDPLIDLPYVKQVAGMAIQGRVTPDDMEGDFLDYNFKIEPYSQVYRTPQMRLQVITQLLREIILPLAPLAAQQGAQVDLPGILRVFARLTNMEEMNEMVKFSTPPPEGEGRPIGAAPPKANVTTRTYERRNVPGATDRGQEQVMQQLFGGSKGQDAQRASIMQPVEAM